MAVDLSLWHLITGASLIVQLVLLLLAVVSLLSWTLIFSKFSAMNAARKEAEEFEEQFWSGGDLASLYQSIVVEKSNANGLAAIFAAGFKEFARLRKQSGVEPMVIVEGAQRVMRVTMSREVDKLEHNLSFLATVGSTSPYVGLFGTVWGIMNAFRALGNVQQATLAMVAPGIAEALIATAMGLFAAIPAVIAYNRLADDVERLTTHYDNFLEEFVSILQRQAHVA